LEDYIQRTPSKAELKIWEASSEVEYALFLLEIDGEPIYLKPENLNCEDEKQNPAECVVRAQTLLQEALELCDASEGRGQVSEKLWAAKRYLLASQEQVKREEGRSPPV